MMDKRFILRTRLAEGQVAIYSLGQMGFLLQYRSVFILIDAYLSDYVDRNACTPLTPWERRYPAPIAPEELDFVQYVFCSHAHSDHMDPYTLSAIAKANPNATFFTSQPLIKAMEDCGVPAERIRGLRCDERVALEEDVAVTAVPAAHEELHPAGETAYLEVGFLLELGETTLFHSGDCCPYDGLEERLQGCDVMMLPINGRDYYRTHVCDIIGCFTSREAVLLAQNCGAGLLIPGHFDLYAINGANPAEFVDVLRTLNPAQRFHIFTPGERYIFEK